MTTRALFIQGLRELADFLESHEDVPSPYAINTNTFVDTREQLARVARSGSWQKGSNDFWFWLRRDFSGNVTLEVNVSREKICRAVVVGKEIIPARAEQVVDKIEWICDESLLAQEEA